MSYTWTDIITGAIGGLTVLGIRSLDGIYRHPINNCSVA
jgi:hypothetical protein